MVMISRFTVASASWPLGRLVVEALKTLRTASRLTPYLLSAVGFNSTRTAGSDPPPTKTVPTPSNWESFCERMVDAASYMAARLRVSEVRAKMRIGASDGLTLR